MTIDPYSSSTFSSLRFGPGPHFVSIKVVLPSDNPSPIMVNPQTQLVETTTYDPNNIRSFQVELAPLSEMPHAVHLFLEQVSHGLWNKMSSFYVNHDHVMQAGPRTREARQQFTDYNLEKLAFPEYSHAFPHKQWTLGFAGRPGGPSFYINKVCANLVNKDANGGASMFFVLICWLSRRSDQ